MPLKSGLRHCVQPPFPQRHLLQPSTRGAAFAFILAGGGAAFALAALTCIGAAFALASGGAAFAFTGEALAGAAFALIGAAFAFTGEAFGTAFAFGGAAFAGAGCASAVSSASASHSIAKVFVFRPLVVFLPSFRTDSMSSISLTS